MNIPDEVIERETGVSLDDDCEYPDSVRSDFTAGAEWARNEALREAASVVRAYPSSHSEHVAAILDERALAEGDNE